MNKHTNSWALLGLVSLLSLTWVSCSPVPGPDKSVAGAVLGAGWGAGAGAVIGNQVNSTGPGIAIGAGFGAASGLLTGIGLDMAEGTELAQQRELDALKIQIAANQRALIGLQDSLDSRDGGLRNSSYSTQIFFDSDLASLRLGSAENLQRLANNIKRNPYVGRIEVHGHSDDTGNAERNQRLSEARARTVATFLVSNGVSYDQISTVSHSSTQPLASNATEAGRQLNRRVELVLKK